MTRYEFLKSCGFTGGALFALLSCVNEEDTVVNALIRNADGSYSNGDGTPINTGTTGVGPDTSLIVNSTELDKLSPLYRVDTSSPLYSRLLTRNNYVTLGNTFVLALSKDGVYLAATVVCSHEFNRSISYRNGEWYCPQHGARFSTTGSGLNDYGKNGLKIYKTAFDGQIIVIYE